MEIFYPLIKQIWNVWLLLLFVGICIWAMWPARRGEMERNARIPLDDEEATHGR